MFLVGIKKVKYEKNGQTIEGLKLYTLEDDPSDQSLEGQKADSIWLSKNLCEKLPVLDDMDIGCSFDVLYNRFGGVKDIKIIEEV